MQITVVAFREHCDHSAVPSILGVVEFVECLHRSIATKALRIRSFRDHIDLIKCHLDSGTAGS